MGIAVATGAGMLGPVGMNASGQPLRLARVAALALDRSHLIRMGIILDGSVAIAALHAAVQAGVKSIAIHADTVTGGVLQALVPVAAEAIGLRLRDARRRHNQKRPQDERNSGSILHLGSDQCLRVQRPYAFKPAPGTGAGETDCGPSLPVCALRTKFVLARCYFCSVRMYAITSLICW